jgi:hypothetical protein
MSTERIVGYLLLGLGIMVMVFAAMQIITVYTNKATPIEFFTSKPIIAQQKPAQNAQIPETSEEMLTLFQNNPMDLLNVGGSVPTPQLIDPDMLNNVLNMAVYFLIMHFLLGLGFKIANLGVQLVRPIKIEVRNNQVASMLEKKKPASPEMNPM